MINLIYEEHHCSWKFGSIFTKHYKVFRFGIAVWKSFLNGSKKCGGHLGF